MATLPTPTALPVQAEGSRESTTAAGAADYHVLQWSDLCLRRDGDPGKSHHKLGQAGDGGRRGSETEQPTTGLVVPSSGRDAICADTAAAVAESKPVDEAIAAEVSAEQEDEGRRFLPLQPSPRNCHLNLFAARLYWLFVLHLVWTLSDSCSCSAIGTKRYIRGFTAGDPSPLLLLPFVRSFEIPNGSNWVSVSTLFSSNIW
ncbi:hypothetical protein BHM03_00042722 [Ensete ventricosum]|nr:hypothetical protein BHM03_00042722 [Ensete ventricosum]